MLQDERIDLAGLSLASPVASTSSTVFNGDVQAPIQYRTYEEGDLDAICALVDSESPIRSSLYVSLFLRGLTSPHLCYLAIEPKPSSDPIGVIICKQDVHRSRRMRGYIGMLSIRPDRRKRGIATKLVELVVERMQADGAEEVVLETEVDNAASLSLYERRGFMRAKRLHRFYFNAKDAFRLVLPLPPVLRPLNTENDSMYT